MLHSDLMQFKDEMLKTLREMESKIMTKVNKNQEKFSNNLSSLSTSINSLQLSTESIIGEITEQKLSISKISQIELDLKKFNTELSTQGKKINDSLIEITYIRDKYEKSLADSLVVPGYIGKGCKYSNFSDYIINNAKEISRLKTEKDLNKKETREMKQKFEQSIKNLSSLFDTFVNRSKIYTDATKKSIIDLIDSKINDLDAKNLELLARICKLDSELEEKIKIFEDNMKYFNLYKTDHNHQVEDKLININNNIEEINKKINETKNELTMVKSNEEKYSNELDIIKQNVNTILKTDNSNETIINSDDIKFSKEINSITSKIKNIKEIKNDNANKYNYNNSSFININSISNKNKKNANYLNDNSMEKGNDYFQYNNSSRTLFKSNINEIPLNQKQLNLIIKRAKNKENLIIKENKKMKFSNNISKINNASSTYNSFHKNNKSANPELFQNFYTNNKKVTNRTFREGDIMRKKTLDKNNDLIINKPINYSKKQFFDFKKKLNVKLDDEIDIFQNKNTQKEKPINNIKTNKIKNAKENFPMIKEKFVNNLLLNTDGIFTKKNFKKNIIILPNSKKNKQSQKNKSTTNKKNMKLSIDKETGVGCKIVKLAIEDDSITPYNTNGLITMASNQFLNNQDAMSFSFDNIFSNIYQYQTKRKYIFSKKPKCHRTIQAFYGDDKINFEKILSSIDNNIKKEFSKTLNNNINNNIAFDNEIINNNINKK